jgi:glutathione synthase/RimK-type ligase-like ATP-grasp enzyme
LSLRSKLLKLFVFALAHRLLSSSSRRASRPRLRRTAREVPVLNSLTTVLWNLNKFYLQELESQGIKIAPTIFVTGHEAIGAAERSQIENWPMIVVKPAVSASTMKTK